MTKITPCLWFDSEAEEAARFYVSLFPNSSIGAISRYPDGLPGQAGKVMTVEFTLDGAPFVALNGGPHFKFTEAISYQIYVEDQAELDRYWKALTDGGEEGPCGWLKDRFGLSWQVVPRKLASWMSNPSTAGRVGAAFMQMKKFDIAALEAAAAG